MTVATLWWLTVSAASAGDLGRAVAVGSGAVVGEVVVGALGGGVGSWIGGAACGSTGAGCRSQSRGLAIGATVGAVTGAVAGAGVSAHVVDARPLPPLVAAGATAALGAALFVAGGPLEPSAVAVPGLVLGAVGAPIAAGLAAGLTPSPGERRPPRARVLPTLGATSGFEIRGAF